MQNVLETPKTGRNKLTKQNYYYSNPNYFIPFKNIDFVGVTILVVRFACPFSDIVCHLNFQKF